MVYVHLEGTILIWLFTHFGFSSFWLNGVLTFQCFITPGIKFCFEMTFCRRNVLKFMVMDDAKVIVLQLIWSSLAYFEICHLKVAQICLHLLTKFVAFSAGILSSRSYWVVTCLSLSVQLFYAEYLLIPLMRWFACTIWRPTWCVSWSPAKSFKFPLKQALLQSAASSLHLLQGTSFVSISIVASQ